MPVAAASAAGDQSRRCRWASTGQPLRVGGGRFQVRPGGQAEAAFVGLQQGRIQLPRGAPPHHLQGPRLDHFGGMHVLPLRGIERGDPPVRRVRRRDHLRQRHAPQQVQAALRAIGDEPQQAVFQQQVIRPGAIQADCFEERRQRGQRGGVGRRRLSGRHQQAAHRIDDVAHAGAMRQVARAGVAADRQPRRAMRARGGDRLLAFVAAVVGHERGLGRGAPVHHADFQPVGHQ
ncbi:hypothetical protein ARC20_08455 [Stenotrophomonas panacihumi]|uniref:Uncharacterized protein n=1 Tax=Stenotrophomonas panacihumi TaxID=676599 RepID=A0A0R0AT71_9GAMM|nr:hypothetical protein ARC20_08455 [Stenotrophomonas panacihumi]PTN54557.1 hypothetical protein C9J98_09975 [Stenotrophomonas panacihumi]